MHILYECELRTTTTSLQNKNSKKQKKNCLMQYKKPKNIRMKKQKSWSQYFVKDRKKKKNLLILWLYLLYYLLIFVHISCILSKEIVAMRIFCFIEFSSNFLFLFHLFLLKLKKIFHLSLPFIYFSFPPNISCLSSLKYFAKYCNQKIQQYLLTLNFHFAESVFRIKTTPKIILISF